MSGYPNSWDQPFTTPFDPNHQRAAQAQHPAYGQHPGHQVPQPHAQHQAPPIQGDGYDWSSFDPAEFEDDFAPDGTHLFQITDAEIRATRKGGLMLSCRLELQNGQGCFARFNLKNDNPDAERIGKQQLVKLLKAVGLPDMRGGTPSLKGRRGLVTISHKEDKTGTMRENLAFKAAPPAPSGAPQYAPPVPGQMTAPGLPQDGAGMMRPIDQLPSQQLPPLDPQFAQRPNPFTQR